MVPFFFFGGDDRGFERVSQDLTNVTNVYFYHSNLKLFSSFEGLNVLLVPKELGPFYELVIFSYDL
jgi:hypothetical protein